MSLRSFHVFFIAVSILFMIGFGIWFIASQPVSREEINILAGLICFSFAGGLVVYAFRFLQKFKALTSQ